LNNFLGDKRMKGKVIAIHSSRGGTGKTLIATNLAAAYANKGLNAALLDLDFRAPSLLTVFSKGIKGPVKHWLNDFMNDQCTVEQALIDVSGEYNLKGKLLVGLANPAIDAIRDTMGRSRAWEVAAVKKLFSLRSTLSNDMSIDCCIFDTSPGIQYSSINSVISSDVSIIVLTLDSLDIEGVQKMLAEFYDDFEKRVVVLMNKVFPQTQVWSNGRQKELISQMETSLKHPIIGVIPCYCDVLQSKRTSLLTVERPDHPFLKDLQEVVKKLEHIQIE
jgi:MinD-like ATPase involved in chromosome partitioning or flagellar assembly